MSSSCPVCQSRELQFVYRFCDGPVMQNLLLKTRSEALRAEKAPVTLIGCRRCGFLFNADFDEKKTGYAADYENTQDYSPYFYRYLHALAKRLVSRFQLKGKTVVELGCGKGHFLKMLVDLGVTNLKGFDPSYEVYDSVIDPLVSKAFFDGAGNEKFDFLICRHVLEHIDKPSDFVDQCIRGLQATGAMFFEFPSLEWIIKNKCFFDFFYEHCNYFSRRSVQVLFESKGFQVSLRYGLEKQYFQLELRRNVPREKRFRLVNFSTISTFLDDKMREVHKKIKTWKHFFLWGAGAKGVTFLTRLNISREQCPFVIDINQEKQGKFIPITSQEVVSPSILKRFPKTTVIIMNPAYQKEMKNMARKYGFQGKFIIAH